MDTIIPSENLTRFIFHRNNYRPSNNTVKYNVFLPNPNDGKTSVFRISDLSDNDIWNIGKNIREKPAIGRADIISEKVLSKNLKIIPSEPPKYHADISNWPAESSEQKLIALELAEEAQLFLIK